MCHNPLGSMKKILTILVCSLFISGCIETASLMAPMSGVASGKVAQTTINSAVSFGIKKKTGKSPMEHAINLAEKNNKPTKIKKKNCISFLENTSQELCSKLESKFVKIQNAIDKKYQIKRLD